MFLQGAGPQFRTHGQQAKAAPRHFTYTEAPRAVGSPAGCQKHTLVSRARPGPPLPPAFLGLDAPAAVSDDAQRMLTEAAEKMPELGFWHDVTKEWDAAIYLLTHLARGVFAVPIAEALFVRSSGRSGKDTSCNIMCSLLGTYSFSLSCDSLCSIPSPDTPSPTIASLGARRFVAVREVGEGKMLASVFKRLCDPVSE